MTEPNPINYQSYSTTPTASTTSTQPISTQPIPPQPQPPVTSSTVNPSMYQTEKRKLPTWAKVVITLTILMAVGVAIAAPAIIKVNKAADAFMKAATGGNATTAYQLASPEFQQTTSLNEFNEKFTQLINIPYQFSSWNIQTNNGLSTAEVSGSLGSGDDRTPLTIQLIKHGDTWQVMNLRAGASAIDD